MANPPPGSADPRGGGGRPHPSIRQQGNALSSSDATPSSSSSSAAAAAASSLAPPADPYADVLSKLSSRLQDIADDPRDTAALSDVLERALKLYALVDGSSSSVPPHSRHPLCAKASADAASRSIHRDLHMCLLRVLSFKGKGEVDRWLSMLAAAILSCEDCYKGYVGVQAEMPARYLHCFSDESIQDFSRALRSWEAGLGLELFKRKGLGPGSGLGALSQQELYAISSLVGVVMLDPHPISDDVAAETEGDELARLFKAAATKHKLLVETTPGLIAMALDSAEASQEWASIQGKAPLRELAEVWVNHGAMRRAIKEGLLSSRNWDGLAFTLRVGPRLAKRHPALARLVIQHLSDNVSGAELKSILRAFKVLLQAYGASIWKLEAAEEWPTSVLSSALDNPALSRSLVELPPAPDGSPAKSAKPLYDWMTAMLDTLGGPSFDRALKSIVHFLLETMQRTHLEAGGSVNGAASPGGDARTAPFLVAVNLLIHTFTTRGKERDVMEGASTVVGLYASTLATFALQGKLPSSGNKRASEDVTRQRTRELVRLLLERDVKSVEEALLEMSSISIAHAKLWKRRRRTRMVKDKEGKSVHQQVGDGLAPERIYELAAEETTYPIVSVCSTLWKEAYRAFGPSEDANIFLDPLFPLSVYSDPTLDVHLLPEGRQTSAVYEAYKEKVKAAIVAISRALRALRGSLPQEIFFEVIDDAGAGRDEALHRLCTEGAEGLVAATLCPLPEIHKAAQTVVRTAFETAETREDCFRCLLQSSPERALRGISRYLDGFIRAASALVEANETAKWMVRSFADVLGALCSPVDGLLRAGSPHSLLDGVASSAAVRAHLPTIWRSMNSSIAVIFAHTQAWSAVLSREELVAWFRDVNLFASETVDQLWAIQHALRATLPKGASEEDGDALEADVISAIATPLDKACSWLRMNELEIVQETRAYMLKAIDAFNETYPLPEAVSVRILRFVEQQLEIKDTAKRMTLLNSVDLLDLRARLTSSSAAPDVIELDSSDDDGVVAVDAPMQRTGSGSAKAAPASDRKPPPSSSKPAASSSAQMVGDDWWTNLSQESKKTGSSPVTSASQERKKQKLRQQKLSFERADGSSPFVSQPSGKPPPPTKLTELGATAAARNAFRGAGTSSAPVAAAPQPARSSSKLGQLRQSFNAAQPSWRTPTNNQRSFRDSSAKDGPEPVAPLARSSVQAPAVPPSPAKPARRAGGAVSSDSSSSDSDEDEAEAKGLAALTSNKRKSPVKMMRAKAPQAVRKTKLLQDPAVVAAQKAREEAERKRRLRAPPDLSPLHRAILSWDYFAEGDSPPSLGPEAPAPTYRSVPDTFANADEYGSVFGPMLLLECWASFLQAKEEEGREPGGVIQIVGRSSVDAFVDLNATMPPNGPTESVRLSETDVVYLRERQGSGGGRKARTVLAKVENFRATPMGNRLTLRCCLTTDRQNISSALVNGTEWRIGKLFVLTTLHREFAALMALRYYDLLSEILSARAAPRAKPLESELRTAMTSYQLNKPQAEAVIGALSSQDGFTLVQGPPGTGKTKTICALIAHFIATRRNAPTAVQPGQAGTREPKRKILLCAPSNAAIDEVARRAREGFAASNGKVVRPNVVRVGRDDVMNVAVKDLSLDYLVEQRVSAIGSSSGEAADPATLHAEIRQLRAEREVKLGELDSARAKGNSALVGQLEAEVKALTSRRMTAMSKLDDAKDRRQSASRQQEADRRRVQMEILFDADVVCTTLAGAGHHSLTSLPFEFETVIIDEAAQAVELSALIPLRYGAKRCILVGDPNQLPPTVISQRAERLKYSQSLFVRMFNRHQAVFLLSIQYRMHPTISAFPSKTFYGSQLRDGPDMAELTKQPWHRNPLLSPYKFFNVRRGQERSARGHSVVNTDECLVVAALYLRLKQEAQRASQVVDGRVGIVTMYKEQVFELKRIFRQRFGPGIDEVVDFNTVDGFQGQEKDVIILSCVRTKALGFITDRRRINVAVTRAKSNLFIVGNADFLRSDKTMWSSLIEQSESMGALVTATPELFTQQLAAATLPAVSPAKGAPTGPRRAQALGPARHPPEPSAPPPVQPPPPPAHSALAPPRLVKGQVSKSAKIAKRPRDSDDEADTSTPAGSSSDVEQEAKRARLTEARPSKASAAAAEGSALARQSKGPTLASSSSSTKRPSSSVAPSAPSAKRVSAVPPLPPTGPGGRARAEAAAAASRPNGAGSTGDLPASTSAPLRAMPSMKLPASSSSARPPAQAQGPPPPSGAAARPASTPSGGPSKAALSSLFVNKKKVKPGKKKGP